MERVAGGRVLLHLGGQPGDRLAPQGLVGRFQGTAGHGGDAPAGDQELGGLGGQVVLARQHRPLEDGLPLLVRGAAGQQLQPLDAQVGVPGGQRLGPQRRRVHAEGLQVLEGLEPDGLVGVGQRLQEDRPGRAGVVGILLREGEDAGQGGLRDAGRLGVGGGLAPALRARLLADEPDVGPEGELAELLRAVLERHRLPPLRPPAERRDLPGVPLTVHRPRLVEGGLFLRVEVAQEQRRSGPEQGVAVDEQLGQVVHGRRGDLPVGLVAPVVDEAHHERAEGGRVGDQFQRPGGRQAEPRHAARQAGQAPRGRALRVLPLPHHQEQQGPGADLVLRVVEGDDEPVLSRRAQGQRRGGLLVGAEDLVRRLGEDERGHRGIPGAGQAEGGVVLHLGVVVRERQPERVERVGPGRPDQGPRRLLAERGVRAVQERDQVRQRGGVAQLGRGRPAPIRRARASRAGARARSAPGPSPGRAADRGPSGRRAGRGPWRRGRGRRGGGCRARRRASAGRRSRSATPGHPAVRRGPRRRAHGRAGPARRRCAS